MGYTKQNIKGFLSKFPCGWLKRPYYRKDVNVFGRKL